MTSVNAWMTRTSGRRLGPMTGPLAGLVSAVSWGVLWAVCGGLAAQTAAASGPPVGVAWYDEIDRLPLIWSAGEGRGRAGLASSYDRTGGNDDGFNGTHSALYVDDRGEHVIFDEEGPGCVYTIWFTGVWAEAELDWGRLRFYFDGETEPRIDVDPNRLFEGAEPGFPGWAVYDEFEASGGFASIVPLPYARSLKITTERRCGFYGVHFRSYDQPVESWTARQDLGPMRRALLTREGDPAGGETRTVELGPEEPAVLFERSGSGVIRSFGVRPQGRLDPFEARSIRVRAYFDGAREPQVDAPLDQFFGSGLGIGRVDSLFLEMSDNGWLSCRFPMPFRESVRLELVATERIEARFRAAVRVDDALPAVPDMARLGTFHALAQREWPASDPADDYLLARLEGAGKLVGQVLTVRPVIDEVKQWWEGDLRIRVDGEEHPSLHGTGHEEDHSLGGWSTYWMTNPFSLPLFGLPDTGPLKTIGRQANGPVTAYRFWPGGVPFASSLEFTTEHGTENNRAANYSSVVYYYLSE